MQLESDEAGKVLQASSSAAAVPITAIIVLTTFVSTGVSLAGGLALYFESVSSIDSIQKEVALAVMTKIKEPLRATFDEEREAMEWLRREFLYGNRTDAEMFLWGMRDMASYVKAHKHLQQLRIIMTRNFTLFPFKGVAWDAVSASEIDHVTGEHHMYIGAGQANNETAAFCEPLLDPLWENLTLPFGQGFRGLRLAFINPETLRLLPEPSPQKVELYPNAEFQRDRFNDQWAGPLAWSGIKVAPSLTACHAKMVHPSDPAVHGPSNYPNPDRYTAYAVACPSFASWPGMLEDARLTLQEGASFVVAEVATEIVLANSIRPGPNVLGGISADEKLVWTPELLRDRTLEPNELSEDVGEAWRETGKPGGLDRFHTVNGHLVYRSRVFSAANKERLPGAPPAMEIDVMWMRDESYSLRRVNKALVLMLVFVLCVLVSDLALGVVEILLISSPLRDLAKEMRQASELTLTAFEGVGLISIKEVKDLRHSFVDLQRHLLEYKRLVPAHLFKSTSAESLTDMDAQPTDDVMATSRRSRSPRQPQHHRDADRSSHSSYSSHSSSSSQRPTRGSARQSLYARMLSGRARQRLTFFYAQWDEPGLADDFIFQISKIVDETGGNIYFLGEKSVAVAYGIGKKRMQSASVCVTAAFQLAEVSCWCGITSGTTTAGMIRSPSFSAFVIDDEMWHRAKMLAQISEVMQASPLCLKDERIGLSSWAKQTVDVIEPHRHGKDSSRSAQHVQQLLFASKEETVEWMYALAQEAQEELKSTTPIVEALAANGFEEEHLTRLEDLVSQNPENAAAIYWLTLLKQYHPSQPYRRRVYKFYIERFTGFDELVAKNSRAVPNTLPVSTPTQVVTNPLVGNAEH